MSPAGDIRRQLALSLRTAYGEGLLSESTLVQRLDLLFGSSVVDPRALVGDLSTRARPAGALARAAGQAGRMLRRLTVTAPRPAALLALDWTGAQDELLLGRHHACDVVLEDLSVSRRHARLCFRDGSWIVHDLESTNGTAVNGTGVVRCRLLPGDRLTLGTAALVVD